MTARYLIGDVFDGLRSLDDDSVDLIISSPPFLALRSYLPAGDPNKGKEIGSEQTPADYLDVLLDVVQECRRVLAPHGSLVFELGDTYAGSGGAGGDYGPDGLRDGQNAFEGSGRRTRTHNMAQGYSGGTHGHTTKEPGIMYATGGSGWPLSKSLCGIPTLFAWSLAYGRNLLRPERTVDPWRIRNLIAWVRPNPPVGALGDKFRPATSYLTVACVGPRRWFDLDAVRHENPRSDEPNKGRAAKGYAEEGLSTGHGNGFANPAGAPPLDWWEIPTEGFKGSHYATWPRKLLDRPILAMCPRRVCRTCGQPSERITGATEYVSTVGNEPVLNMREGERLAEGVNQWKGESGRPGHFVAHAPTLGWSDCGHGTWRAGLVLDPFAGSGTTLAVAVAHGREAIGIDIDPRNADLAYDRVGMWLTAETITGSTVTT